MKCVQPLWIEAIHYSNFFYVQLECSSFPLLCCCLTWPLSARLPPHDFSCLHLSAPTWAQDLQSMQRDYRIYWPSWLSSLIRLELSEEATMDQNLRCITRVLVCRTEMPSSTATVLYTNEHPRDDTFSTRLESVSRSDPNRSGGKERTGKHFYLALPTSTFSIRKSQVRAWSHLSPGSIRPRNKM